MHIESSTVIDVTRGRRAVKVVWRSKVLSGEFLALNGKSVYEVSGEWLESRGKVGEVDELRLDGVQARRKGLGKGG